MCCTWSLMFIMFCIASSTNDYPSRVGSTHIAGCYNLTTKPYLIEGVETLIEMGTKVIKLQLKNPEIVTYQWNSIWPSNLTTPLQTAQYSYFKQIFSMASVETYIMTTYTSLGGSYWKNGMNQQQFKQESDEIYDVSLYLLTTYPSKTFILSNWEGDWAIRDNHNKSEEPTQQAIDGMITWYAARQDGVTRARQKYYNLSSNINILTNMYMAAEVNLVVQSMENNSFPNTIISVIPYVKLDYIAYSSYDSQCKDIFIDALQFISSHHNKTSFSPVNATYIGEFGLAQRTVNESHLQECIKHIVDTAYSFGCPYIMFWEVYDSHCVNTTKCPNHKCNVETGQQTNVNDLDGFWLVLPNGTFSWPYYYFQSLYQE